METETTLGNTNLPLLRKRLGLTQAEFATLVGISERSVVSVEAGIELNANTQRKLKEAERLADELEGLFRNVSIISKWLSSPNPGFDGRSPLAVIEAGQIDRVWRALYHLGSGSPS